MLGIDLGLLEEEWEVLLIAEPPCHPPSVFKMGEGSIFSESISQGIPSRDSYSEKMGNN